MKVVYSTLFLLSIFLIGGHSAAFGQYWQSIGDSADLHQANYLFADTAKNRLYVTGDFRIADSSNKTIGYHYAKYWNGTRWDTIAKREGGAGGNFWMFRYKGTLYASGNFQRLGNSSQRHWAKYNGTSWDSLQIQPNSLGVEFTVIEDTLYIGGHFKKVGNIYSPHVLKFDGNDFHGFKDTLATRPSSWYVTSIKKYKDVLYAAGNLEQQLNNEVQYDLVTYRNGEWSVPDNWYMANKGGFVNKLEIFQDELYLGGYFYEANGLSNNILKTDGEDWYPLGKGCNSSITDMIEFKEELWVIGSFTECDGIPARFVAKWTGSQWCSLSDVQFNNQFLDVEVFEDSLYFSGRFTNAGLDSANFVTKWNGGDHVWQCGPEHKTFESLKTPWTSAEEVDIVKKGIKLYPNPAKEKITVVLEQHFNSPEPYSVINVAGKIVKEGFLLSTTEIDISPFSKGQYFLLTETESVKFIKE